MWGTFTTLFVAELYDNTKQSTCQNLPYDIHGTCTDFWVFSTNGDAGRKWAVDTEYHRLCLGR